MLALLVSLSLFGSTSARAGGIIAISGQVSQVNCSYKDGLYSGLLDFKTVTIPSQKIKIEARINRDIFDLCEILERARLGKADLTVTQLFILCEGYNCEKSKVVGAVVSQPSRSPIAMFKLP